MTFPVLSASNPSGYNISRSVRLRSSASAYLSRTFGTPTNNTVWTYSCWVKRGNIGTQSGNSSGFFGNSDGYSGMYFIPGDNFRVMDNAGSVASVTNAVYRDPSAWAHLVVKSDGTYIKTYWNNVEVASYTGTITNFNKSGQTYYIGRYSTVYLDGYLTEINFIDGQALTPSSFGAYNAYGVWSPLKYSGTYGNNGFYLNFSDNSNNTAATIGKDYSGNGNNWTPNNISVTAGTTYDSMTDVPTLNSATAANFAVLNPLDKTSSTTAADGNLSLTLPANVAGGCGSTIAVSSGKWYWEVNSTSGSAIILGIVLDNKSQNGANDLFTTGYGYYQGNGNKYVNGTGSAYGASYTTNTIGIALDLDSNTLTFYKDNTSQGAISISAGSYKFTASNGSSVAQQVCVVNFGQRPFAYTPPTGFVALNTYNLTTPTISNGANYMAATLWSGDGTTSRAISTAVNSVSFQPDFVWVKARNNAREHILEDSVRGLSYNNELSSNTTGAEASNPSAGGVTSADATTITLGGTGTMDNVNRSTWTYVGWQWKAGGAAVSNTSGSITSSVSANTTAGFSVVTWTGNGTGSPTIGHGLGVTPNMIVIKNRSAFGSWPVYHSSLTNYTYFLRLDATDASGASGTPFGAAPTSTTFTTNQAVGTNNTNISSNNYVAYCFAAVAGYSAFGSYVGNGSADGTFVYLGFRPRFILRKRTDASWRWMINDSSRSDYNVSDDCLFPNYSNAEEVSVTNWGVDFLSNGFKIRSTDVESNASGGTYIYAAFAENPFKYALAR